MLDFVNEFYKALISLVEYEYGDSVWIDMEIKYKAKYLFITMENGFVKIKRAIDLQHVLLDVPDKTAEDYYKSMRSSLLNIMRRR